MWFNFKICITAAFGSDFLLMGGVLIKVRSPVGPGDGSPPRDSRKIRGGRYASKRDPMGEVIKIMSTQC